MSFFKKRVNRIYIVLIIPLAIFTGFKTIYNAQQYLYWVEVFGEHYEQMPPVVNRAEEDYDNWIMQKTELNGRYNHHSQLVKNYLTITLALLCFPLIWKFIIFIFKWVWHGRKEKS